jgi:hypothetical protein
MDKTLVNEDQYIILCNQELKNHPDFQEGMKIIGVPKDATGFNLTGLNWEGPSTEMPSLTAIVESKVKENYELRVTRKK